MEEYGTKLAPYSISCATKNVNLLPDPVVLGKNNTELLIYPKGFWNALQCVKRTRCCWFVVAAAAFQSNIW